MNIIINADMKVQDGSNKIQMLNSTINIATYNRYAAQKHCTVTDRIYTPYYFSAENLV